MAGPPVSKGFIIHTKSSWQLLTSSTTQTDTGLTAFNMFLKELDNEMECIFSKFLGYKETVKRLEGRLLLREIWTSWRKGVRGNSWGSPVQSPASSREKSHAAVHPGGWLLGSSSAEKDLSWTTSWTWVSNTLCGEEGQVCIGLN